MSGVESCAALDRFIAPEYEATMNDATNQMMDGMANALYTNTTNNQAFIGLNGAVDDGTNLVTYGNINRTANTWWQSKVYSAGSVAPTRSTRVPSAG